MNRFLTISAMLVSAVSLGSMTGCAADTSVSDSEIAEETNVAAVAQPATVVGGCSVFPADNPWNTRIDDTVKYKVHPSWSTWAANMRTYKTLHADWGNWSVDHYGIPWAVVSGQPKVPMSFDVPEESDPGPYPFPLGMRIEGNGVGDAHGIIVDKDTCTLYEAGNLFREGSGWHGFSGAKFNLGSNALRPAGWTSADAAGLPIFAGLVRVAEVKAGVIEHAVRFTIPRSQQAYIAPATHAAGQRNAALLPMGLRLRLKASFSLAGFTGPSLVILTAMKKYGIILADNGSDWFITGDSDDGWDPLMSNVVKGMARVKGSDFEAVDTGPLVTR